jgi:hypothetical protein
VKSHPGRKRKPRAAAVLVLIVLAAVGGGLLWRATTTSTMARPGAAMTAVRRETRALLDPVHFTGKARRAYEVAHTNPRLLDHLRCYCRCDYLGHSTLLSCYTDGHAAT